MLKDTPVRRCPKCGAYLSAERVDHQLSGQERLFCPKHGEIGSLEKSAGRDYGDDRRDPEEFE